MSYYDAKHSCQGGHDDRSVRVLSQARTRRPSFSKVEAVRAKTKDGTIV